MPVFLNAVILEAKEISMQQTTQIMTLQEKTAIGLKALEMEKQGNIEEYHRLWRSIPVEPWPAQFTKM